jgi:hypothetical protein
MEVGVSDTLFDFMFGFGGDVLLSKERLIFRVVRRCPKLIA